MQPTKFQFPRIIKKAEEDLFIGVTPIGREFILVKGWATRFSVLKQSNKAENDYKT
jgi:hypothetical protein